MNPELMSQCQAAMRLAYTQACVNFPRLNVTPIQLALYQIYQNEAYSQGSTFVLMDPEIGGEIMGITAKVQKELLAKEHADRLLVGHSADEAKSFRPLVIGLDVNGGRLMVQQIRNGASKTQLKTTRQRMLQDRRNSLANQIVVFASNMAAQRFQNSVRGEEIAQSRTI